jgi:hypothetical protein
MRGGGCLASCGMIVLMAGAGMFFVPLLFALVPIIGPVGAGIGMLLGSPIAWTLMAIGGFLTILGLIFRDDD